MAPVIYLDTHVAAWLFAGDVSLLSRPARAAVEAHALLVSPAVTLELEYLFETRRTTAPASTVLAYLQDRVGLAVCQAPFPDVVQAATSQSWTRDPFDRLIVGHAVLKAARLLTKDRVIRRAYRGAFW